MSASHADLVAHIHGVLEQVSGIGAIVDRPRDLQTLEDIQDVFGSGVPEQINSCVIRREGVRIQRTGAPGSQEFRFHRYVVLFLYTLNDENETDNTFQELLNRVLDAFTTRRVKATPADTPVIEDTDEIGFRRIGTSNFSGLILHVAELELLLRERIRGIVPV